MTFDGRQPKIEDKLLLNTTLKGNEPWMDPLSLIPTPSSLSPSTVPFKKFRWGFFLLLLLSLLLLMMLLLLSQAKVKSTPFPRPKTGVGQKQNQH